MQRLTQIKFHPVLHFYPPAMEEDFFYPYPITVEERYAVWKEVLGRLGLGKLEPVKLGWDYVRAADIDTETLKTLVLLWIRLNVAEREECGFDHYSDFLPSFAGGLMLTSGEDILIYSQCCIAFEDYKRWIDLKKVNKWNRIWIGHPWIYYQFRGEDILLSEYIEKQMGSKIWLHHHPEPNGYVRGDSSFVEVEAINDSKIRFQIAQPVFEKAITQLKKDIHLFQQRITQVTRELGYEPAEKIANNLVNGNGNFPSISEDDIDEVSRKAL